MKKLYTLLLLITCLLVFAGCQSNASEVSAVMTENETLLNENNDLKAEITQLKNTIAELEARIAELEGGLSVPNVININDLYVGDPFNGLLVAKIENNGHFDIELQGQFTVEGHFCIDDMYGDIVFIPEEPDKLFPTQIDFNDRGVLGIFPSFNLKDVEKLKSEIGSELYTTLANSNSFDYQLDVTAVFENYSMSAKWGSEGGASADLVSLP